MFLVIGFLVGYSHSLNVSVTCSREVPFHCSFNRGTSLITSEKLNFITKGNPEAIKRVTMIAPSTATSVPYEIFEQLPSLEKLELIGVGISSLSKLNFQSANKLTNLDLEGNKIQYVPTNVISLAPELYLINLAYNEITNIEDGAFNSSHLNYIYLSRNKLTSLKKRTFSNALDVHYIYLANNSIEYIEEGTFDLPTLELITLDYNRLKTLPANLFVNSPNLNFLSLVSNELTEIVIVLEKAPKLMSIFLDDNPLLNDNIIASLGRFPQLRTLSLRNTSLVSPVASESPELLRLYLDRNNLSDIRLLHQLKQLKNLDLLSVENNNFKKLEEFNKIKEYLPRLRLISMSANRWDCEWLNSIKTICNEEKLVECDGAFRQC